MSDKPQNPPAFPELSFKRIDTIEVGESVSGMTLRDYFSAKAMQAMLSDIEKTLENSFKSTYRSNADFIAAESYMMADAMLKAREA